MRRTLILALALSGAALSSQDLTGGVYTGLSMPVGDLKDKTDLGTNQFFGTHVGGHLDFNITPHHQVRAHITFLDFPETAWGGPADAANHYKDLQFGADWVYSFQSTHQGWYSVAGASLNSMKDDYAYNGPGTRYVGTASQSGKLGVRGGAGYTFNKWFSLEGTLNQVFVDKDGADGFGFDTATWMQVSAVFRFGH